MRIAIDAMTLSSQDTGVGIWTRGLIRSLTLLDRDNEYLIYHGLGAAGLSALGSPKARYVPVPVPNTVRPVRVLYEQLLLPRRVRRDRVDVLHCPAYVRPLRAGVPTVVTVHDLFAFTHPGCCKRLNVLHFRLAMPPSIRRATLIHCTSDWTRRMLAERFPQAAPKAHVIHPGVDDIFRPRGDDAGAAALFARLGLAAPPFLFVGSAEPKKNVPLLLTAYAELKRRFGTARGLLMVGRRGWAVRPVLRCIAALRLRRDVARAGYVDRDQLPAIYRSSLALVFPSLCEGFGLPPVEAMACGIPVICTGGSGLAESADGAARIVPCDDPSALAEAMHEVEESADLRARLREAGLRHAAGFRWEDKAREFVRLYELAASQ